MRYILLVRTTCMSTRYSIVRSTSKVHAADGLPFCQSVCCADMFCRWEEKGQADAVLSCLIDARLE